MNPDRSLEFFCTECDQPILLAPKENLETLTCRCGQTYKIDDPNLIRQLKKFAKLCSALSDAEEILSSTSVGVDVGGRQVKIPYKLLLTRLNTRLEMQIGGKNVVVTSRLETLPMANQ